MTEDEVKESEAAETAAESDENDGTPATEIRDTDIVFDCPHCGHNLAIDYRGAGLQINCVNCGESVLVPIPTGMKIDDLDLEPGEILKQLFATRRNLQKAELLIADLEERLRAEMAKNETYRVGFESLATQAVELKTFCRKQAKAQQDVSDLVDSIVALLPGNAGAEALTREAQQGADAE